MSGDSPTGGWRSVTLDELGSFRRGRGGTKRDERPTGIPCVRYGDLYTVHDSIIQRPASFIAPSSAHTYTPLQYGDVVFAASGETHEEIGTAAAYCGSEMIVAGADTIIFHPNGSVAPRFMGYAVNAEAAVRQKARLGQGSSVIHISVAHLPDLSLPVPPLPEQRRIAEILDAVAEAIRKTEEIIKKLKAMKQGLLHDLLTRGIAENGELRDPERHPEKFKDSVLGRIPREWQIVPLQSVSAHITKGSTPTTFGFEWAETGVLFLRSECVREGSFSAEGGDRISEAAHRAMSRSVIVGGDILMTITGYIGRSCLYPLDMPEANINQHIARIRITKPDSARPQWVAWALQDPRQRRLLKRDLTGLAYPQISLAQVQSIPLPLPTAPEQARISAALDAAEGRLGAENSTLTKLRLLKKGLMEDLLTGRVRVSVSEEAA